MDYTSEQTVALLNKAHAALVSGRETTAAAIAAREVALVDLQAALDIVEPLKAENSALQTLSQNLEAQIENATLELNQWKAQDAAEDAALTPLDEFLNPVTPPVDPPTEPEDETSRSTPDGDPVPADDQTTPAGADEDDL